MIKTKNALNRMLMTIHSSLWTVVTATLGC